MFKVAVLVIVEVTFGGLNEPGPARELSARKDYLITVLGKASSPPVRAGPSPGGAPSATGLPGYQCAGPAPIS
jgi:hypothetical protein